jgi:hypothetical protein
MISITRESDGSRLRRDIESKSDIFSSSKAVGVVTFGRRNMELAHARSVHARALRAIAAVASSLKSADEIGHRERVGLL